jgi:hypothetical protein
LFHKHHQTIGRKRGADAGTLQHYKSLYELREAVKPYEASYPLTDTDRTAAHARFITEDGGNGEALRIATLEDGTEVILVLTEDASRAYGSPRWCTAYRNQDTFFEDYKDDLLVVIDPDGERWQFHFRSEQFHDENDYAIEDLPEFLNSRNGLSTALSPYWEKTVKEKIRVAKDRWYFSESLLPLDLAASVSTFKTHASQKDGFLDQTLNDLRFERKNNDKNVLLSIVKLLKDDPDFQYFLEPHIFDKAINAFNKEIIEPKNDYFSYKNFEELWRTILSVPTWKERAIEAGQFKSALETLLQVGNESTLKTFLDLVEEHTKDEAIRAIVQPMLLGNAFDVFHGSSDHQETRVTSNYMKFYRLLMSDPDWKDMALEQGVNEKSFHLLDRTFNSYDKDTGIYQATPEPIKSSYIDFCTLIRLVPEWDAYAQEQGYYARAVTDGHLARRFDEYEGHAKNNKFFGTTSRDYIKQFWGHVLEIAEWREYSLNENRLGGMLDILFDEDLKPKRGLGFYNDHAKKLLYFL